LWVLSCLVNETKQAWLVGWLVGWLVSVGWLVLVGGLVGVGWMDGGLKIKMCGSHPELLHREDAC